MKRSQGHGPPAGSLPVFCLSFCRPALDHRDEIASPTGPWVVPASPGFSYSLSVSSGLNEITDTHGPRLLTRPLPGRSSLEDSSGFLAWRGCAAFLYRLSEIPGDLILRGPTMGE